MTEHPAKYSDRLLPYFARELREGMRILDPMAGVGKIFLLEDFVPDLEIFALEIEPEWAAENPRITVGDALDLPWPDAFFDAICVSPTYANRMADHHNAKDASKRHTYTHTLGRKLHPHNSGQLQWGKNYRAFHYAAWCETSRVLRPGGKFILNISDHIRKGKVIPVTRFHDLCLSFIGFRIVNSYRIETPRQRHGENGEKRVEFESILVFQKKFNYVKKESPDFSDLEKVWPKLEDAILDGDEGVDRFSQHPIVGKPENE